MKKYTPQQRDLERISNDFRYHKPHADDQSNRYEAIRALMGSAAVDLLGMCPPSRELSMALTKLDEAMFWANASITRNEKPEV